jgi:hypothetical protein
MIGNKPIGEAKVDELATEGLNGTPDSLAYRVEEIEKHFHNRECWRGKLAVQSGTNWADDNIDTPFVAVSGANDWGTDTDDEAKVLGTGDTPFIGGNVKFDPHRILITAVSSSTPYKMRLIWGTGTMAEAIAANQWSCFMYRFDSISPAVEAGFPVDIKLPRLRSGIDKLWAQVWNLTDNATISFFIGIHEYDG